MGEQALYEKERGMGKQNVREEKGHGDQSVREGVHRD